MLPSSPLVTSIDSLIVAAALSAVVRPRHVLPLIALFGVSDFVGSTLGPTIDLQLSNSDGPIAIFLMLWGGLICTGVPVIERWCRSPLLAYVLAPLMAIDNLLVPSATPVLDGVASCVMAALGFAIGLPFIPGLIARRSSTRWLGLPLAVAGGLLAL